MRRNLVAGLVVAGLALSACAEEVPVEERVAAAQEATTAPGTARVAFELTHEIDGDDGDSALSVAGHGDVDFAAEQAALALDHSEIGERVRAVVDGDVVYTEPPSTSHDQIRWRRHEQSPRRAQLLFGPGMAGQTPDPLRALRILGAVEGDVDALGEDEVRGEPVDGFAFTAGADALVGQAEDAAELADVDADVRAWLDADDRVRRLVVELTLADLLAGRPDDAQVPDHVADSPVTFAVELFDFGSQVAIDVPDEDTVFDSSRGVDPSGEPLRVPDGTLPEGADAEARGSEAEAEAGEPSATP